jgi:hypothetical protein
VGIAKEKYNYTALNAKSNPEWKDNDLRILQNEIDVTWSS